MKNLQMKWPAVIGLMVSIALLLGACDAVPWASAQSTATPLPTVTAGGVLSAEGRLVPLHSSALSFLSGGELGELLVSEGDTVAQGDALARLGKLEPLQAALSQAKLELLSAQQAVDTLNESADIDRTQSGQALIDARNALNEARNTLENLDTDSFQQQLDDRVIAMQDAADVLKDAKDELDKYQNLDSDNATRKNAQAVYNDAQRSYNTAVYNRDTLQNQLDQAKAAVDLAAARLDDAQRQSDNRKGGVDADKLALAQAHVDLATAQVAAAQRGLDNAVLTAPYSAMVVDLNDLEPGESVTPGRTVVTIADFSAWLVETRDLTELDVVSVEPGQDVQVTPDALPDLQLTGTVESIDRVFAEKSGDILYTVRIRLNETDPRLRWGMTVNVVFKP